MSALLERFELPPELEASEPPEVRLGRRDAVRMLVSIGNQAPRHTTARDLGTWLRPGDLVVVNTSATVPAALDATTDDGQAVVVHVSTELPTGLHLVEVRHPGHDGTTWPDPQDFSGRSLHLGRRRPHPRARSDARVDPAVRRNPRAARCRCSSISTATAGRSGTGTCPSRGRSMPTSTPSPSSRARRRCRRPGGR